MVEAIDATGQHRRRPPDGQRVSPAMRCFLRCCASGVFALVLVGLPVTGLAAPAISRADDPCSPAGTGTPT